MSEPTRPFTRRRFLKAAAAAGVAASLVPPPSRAAPAPVLAEAVTKAIPGTGEPVPVIGMGSWITFDVGDDAGQRARRVDVLRAFFAGGGAIVDSSPMYGSSEDVIGHCLERIEDKGRLFAATKVWTPMQWYGERQMEISSGRWGVERFDLMQVHNLWAWEAHLETLARWKAGGRVRYVGVTTSHGRRHGELEGIMASTDIDFVQFTYNIADREAETRLLPLAKDRGLAVIANRPFRRGDLIERLEGHPLPPWAAEIGCTTWPPFLLKFVVSHPAVTCAIPATSRPDHMRENMEALRGPLPDAKTRARMIEYVESL